MMAFGKPMEIFITPPAPVQPRPEFAGFVMAVDDQIICQPETDKPIKFTFREFTYWGRVIHRINPRVRVTVVFGTRKMMKRSHKLLDLEKW